MPEFAYIARDLTGNRVEGTLAAGTEREVVAALSGRDLFPLKVASADGRAAGADALAAGAGRGSWRPPTASSRRCWAAACRCCGRSKSFASKRRTRIWPTVLEDVHSRVQEGATLADAMARHPRAFGELATSIVRAGGEGGFLEEALDRLAKFTEQQDELKSRVIGALAYPTILFVLGTIVVNVLIIFFVPKFENAVRRLARTRRTAGRHRLAAVAQRTSMQSYGIFIVAGAGRSSAS